MVLRLPDSWSNWNLETLVFEEMGKPEYLEKNLSAQMRELTTNSTHIWRRRGDSREGSLPTSLRAFQANPNLLSPQKYTSLDSYRIKKFPLWGADSKSCGFAFRIHRIRKRKVGHLKISGYAWGLKLQFEEKFALHDNVSSVKTLSWKNVLKVRSRRQEPAHEAFSPRLNSTFAVGGSLIFHSSIYSFNQIFPAPYWAW